MHEEEDDYYREDIDDDEDDYDRNEGDGYTSDPELINAKREYRFGN